ncbi:hypothetical protein WDU94_004562 [Cyamophila willieti]
MSVFDVSSQSRALYIILASIIFLLFLFSWWYYKRTDIIKDEDQRICFFCQRCGYKNNFFADKGRTPKVAFFERPGTLRQFKPGTKEMNLVSGLDDRVKSSTSKTRPRLRLISGNRKASDPPSYDPLERKSKIDKIRAAAIKARESKTNGVSYDEKPIGGFFKRIV